MDIAGWESRYRQNAASVDDTLLEPTPLVSKFVSKLPGGTALDVAAGTGRNSVWLASQGWTVTAVDGSPTAIATLRKRSGLAGVLVETFVADLEAGEYAVGFERWDLVVICYYLQRNLFESAKAGVRSGGLLIVIVHITEGGEEPTASRLRPGELEQYFEGWEILHAYEGKPNDPEHRRSVAEIVARKP